MRETRRTTLTEEEVLALPVIRYGEENINNLIEKHQPISDRDDLSEADAPDNGNVDYQVESNGDNVTKYEDGVTLQNMKMEISRKEIIQRGQCVHSKKTTTQ